MKICNKILQIGLLSAALGSLFGCSVAGRLQRQQMTASLSQLTRAERQERQQDYRPQVVKLQRDSNTFFLAPVDTLADGERVMALQIEQVTVVAKMRSIPERNGRVVLDFIVTLPRQLLGKSRSVVITPISAQARRIRGARRSGDPRRTLLAAARARLLAVRNLCRTLPPRYRGARGGLQPLREVSLSRRRPARLAGRRQEHRHVLLFPSSENRRDLEEDARNASGAGVGRGRQRLPSAAVRYVELRRILDALLCRYRAEVSHQGHRQVRDRRRPQLHSVLRGRYPCGRYAGRQPAAAGQDHRPDAADRRTAGVLCRYHHADGGIVSGGSLCLQRPALARKGRGAQTLPCPPIRQKHRHDAYRAVGSRGLAGADKPHPNRPGDRKP